eukprot:1797226-Rhodomonas_salina.2
MHPLRHARYWPSVLLSSGRYWPSASSPTPQTQIQETAFSVQCGFLYLISQCIRYAISGTDVVYHTRGAPHRENPPYLPPPLLLQLRRKPPGVGAPARIKSNLRTVCARTAAISVCFRTVLIFTIIRFARLGADMYVTPLSTQRNQINYNTTPYTSYRERGLKALISRRAAGATAAFFWRKISEITQPTWI